MQNSQSKGSAPVSPASRRRFFAGSAAVGAAAAAAAVLPAVFDAAPEAQAVPVLRPAPANGGGYSLSEHVKHYYRTTSA